MGTPPAPRHSVLSGVAHSVREAFWLVALGLIACYAFFVALGAFSPGDVIGVSVAVGVLTLLWLVHAWAQSHRPPERDPRRTTARERRGF